MAGTSTQGGVAETPRDPDRDVLDLVRTGDLNGALRRLMQRHGAAVYRYCREALGDPVLADDVLQQVFIAAFRNLPKFMERCSLRTWLFTIARNRVLDAVKSRRRTQARTTDIEQAKFVVLDQPSSIDSLDDIQLHEALMASLEDLDPYTRSLILLRFQQGFTFKELAEICHASPGALHARVTRALPRLRAGIEGRIAASKQAGRVDARGGVRDALRPPRGRQGARLAPSFAAVAAAA